MNRLEDRLRDAFGAAAETVRPDSVAGLADQTRAVRVRRLAPLAAAAAVALVVIAISVSVPLTLTGGHGTRPASGGTGTPSPGATSGPSAAAVTTVPMVVGMTENQATLVLQAAGLQVAIVFSQGSSVLAAGTVIAQNPVPGTRLVSGATITVTVAAGSGSSGLDTLPQIQAVTFSEYAVTITIEKSWQPVAHLGPVRGYRGVDGFVQVGGIAETGTLQAACTAVASQPAYGSQPQITYRSIDGQPGCQIVPSGDAPVAFQPPGGPGLPRTSALVEYRTPLSGGDNFLLISTDPPHLQQVVDSIQLHH